MQSKKIYARKIISWNTLNETEEIYLKPEVTPIEDDWDFKNANTKEYTHCFHIYPAMMIPQVARRIIRIYGKSSKILFDPFCGSGTSLVEANLNGVNAIGTDINPLARLIAKTKTTKISVKKLDDQIQDYIDYIYKLTFNPSTANNFNIPRFHNIDFWFSKDVQYQLAVILNYVKEIKDLPIHDFFLTALSETIRESSYQKKGEFKLVRQKDFLKNQEQDVYSIMLKKLKRNQKGLIEFISDVSDGFYTQIYNFNTVEKIPESIIPKNSIDIVVTSPPYGDSRTTVAYGQFSRLANEWLGFTDARKIDNLLMGGRKIKYSNEIHNELLNTVVNTIAEMDEKRAVEVYSFFYEYYKSIENISTVIKHGGFACFVVGNRTVKGIKIPTDELTIQFFEDHGFRHIETIQRNIPNKRMPLKNSPTNISGQTASTIKTESIVICQKQ